MAGRADTAGRSSLTGFIGRSAMSGLRHRREWVVVVVGDSQFDKRRFAGAAAVTALVGTALLSTTAAVVSGRPREGAAPVAVISLSDPQVVVIKSKRTLYLFDGEQLIRSYSVDLGRGPAGPKRVVRDGRTPVGVYRIVSKNPNSAYHRFLGLDYPDAAATRVGLSTGLISWGEATQIASAIRAGRRPLWLTDLGGGVGIHGRRRGHDWTGGCIAMEDGHIEELYAVLRIGDRVEILP